ncbi:MAG: branched-chain amino acid ABC transporter permease [Solirubrobacterales bacterium]
MTEFLQQTVNGLSLASTYVLVGVGLTLVLGVARVMNYAQGQLLVAGAFIGYGLVSGGLPWWLAVLAAPIAVALIGIVLREAIFKRGTDDFLAMFILTIGLGIVIEQLLVKSWGPGQRKIASPLDSSVEVLGVVITSGRLFLICVSVPVIVALVWVLMRTDLGRRMRATAENPAMAELVGVDSSRSQVLAFAVGSGLAGLAGVLLGLAFPFTAFEGGSLLVKALAIVIIGGAGNVVGAILVGVGLGLVEAYGSAYGIPLGFATLGAEWSSAYVFVLLIAVLAWRPSGLLRGTGDL